MPIRSNDRKFPGIFTGLSPDDFNDFVTVLTEVQPPVFPGILILPHNFQVSLCQFPVKTSLNFLEGGIGGNTLLAAYQIDGDGDGCEEPQYPPGAVGERQSAVRHAG